MDWMGYCHLEWLNFQKNFLQAGFHSYGVLCLARMECKTFQNRERERENREKEKECGAVGATSTSSTVGLFSFLTMLFLPTFSQH